MSYMRAKLKNFVFLIGIIASTNSAYAQGVDTAGIRTTVQTFFNAMESNDTVTLRRLMAPGLSFAVIAVAPQGARSRFSADSSFLRSIAGAKEKLLERMWNPTIHIDGPLAVVWAPYDFHIGSKFSHCGTDVFTLMKTDSGWLVVGLTYTVQRDKCQPSPLGPPGKTP